MKKHPALAILVLWAILAGSLHAGEKKCLLVMFDGTRADALLSASTPNIDSVRLGTWAEGYKGAYTFEAYTSLDAPPSSATNHVAILTGVTARKNRCFKNGQTASAKYDLYPTVSKMIADADPDFKSAWFYMWPEDGDIQTRATYISPPQEDEPNVEDAVALLDGTFPTKDGVQGSHWTAGDDIDLVMIYNDKIDANGHSHGFSVTTPEYMNYIEEVDSMIGRLLTAIKNRPNFAGEDWLIVFNSDHGGIGQRHGVVGSQNCYTVPFIVSSKETAPGLIVGDARNSDSAAYIMQHFTGSIPEYFDSKINKTVPITQLPLTEQLIGYFPFEDDVEPAVGDFAGDESFVLREYPEDGKIGKAISFRGSDAVCFGTPPALQFGEDRSFTFAFWFRTDIVQHGSSPFMGNKDVDDREQAGLVFRSNVVEDDGDALGLVLCDSLTQHNISPLAYEPNNQWHFAAITYNRSGDAVVYLGMPNGNLAFIAERMHGSGNIDCMDWYLGQDGSGINENHFVGDIDEFMVWDRSLNPEEVYRLFRKGLSGEAVTD